MRIIGTLFFVSCWLISCGGNSIESDAQKVAELQCKAEQLMKQVKSGNLSLQTQSEELTSVASAISKAMEEKYTSDSDKKKFADILSKELENCGND